MFPCVQLGRGWIVMQYRPDVECLYDRLSPKEQQQAKMRRGNRRNLWWEDLNWGWYGHPVRWPNHSFMYRGKANVMMMQLSPYKWVRPHTSDNTLNTSCQEAAYVRSFLSKVHQWQSLQPAKVPCNINYLDTCLNPHPLQLQPTVRCSRITTWRRL